MRISDWSSDVCSSDLHLRRLVALGDAHLDDDRIARRAIGDEEIHIIGAGRLIVRGPREKARRGIETRPGGQAVGPIGERVEVFVNPDELEFERSEEHTSELQSLMRISYAGLCLKKKKNKDKHH